MTSPATTIEKPKRRWLQFSLRQLLVLMVVIAVLLGWTIHTIRQQRTAVAALEKVDCTVGYGANWPPTVFERMRKLLGEAESRTVIAVNGYGSQLTDSGLVYLLGLNQLKRLDLQGTQITDAGLIHLQGLIDVQFLESRTNAGDRRRTGASSGAQPTQLQVLGLGRTQITDAGLVHLRGLNQLQVLELRLTHITDNGLVHVKTMGQLTSLVLNGTQVTDAGLVYLRGLNQLKELRLSFTHVTDAGLVHLQGMSNLKSLDIDRTQVTDAGVQQLQKALPKCHIR